MIQLKTKIKADHKRLADHLSFIWYRLYKATVYIIYTCKKKSIKVNFNVCM